VKCVAALCAGALLLSACALPPIQPSTPSRTPTRAEQDEVKRSVVTPYFTCMQTEARKLADSGVGARGAAEAAELQCGRLIQELRRYGAAKDYDPLRWSEYVEQVEREGHSIAMRAHTP
jgi:hypothetical protein